MSRVSSLPGVDPRNTPESIVERFTMGFAEDAAPPAGAPDAHRAAARESEAMASPAKNLEVLESDMNHAPEKGVSEGSLGAPGRGSGQAFISRSGTSRSLSEIFSRTWSTAPWTIRQTDRIEQSGMFVQSR